MLVAQDDPAFGPADYNAVAADFQLPPLRPGEGVGLVLIGPLRYMFTYADALRTARPSCWPRPSTRAARARRPSRFTPGPAAPGPPSPARCCW